MANTRAELEAEDAKLTDQLANSDVAKDRAEMGRLAKRRAEIVRHLELLDAVTEEQAKIVELETMLGDASLAEMATEELADRRRRLAAAQAELTALERPKDPDADK